MKQLTKPKILELFTLLNKNTPSPKIELTHTNPFTLMIAVVLSAQSTDKHVNKVTPAIFEKVSTPQNVVTMGHPWLREKLNSINYNNTKAKNIFLASQMLVEKYNGEMPRTLKELELLPGVGRKSANVILNSSFGIPTLAVDTHVFRVCNRTGLAKAKNVLETERQVFPKLPKEFELSAHHLLVLHGRYVCKARKPECTQCVIAHLCLKVGVDK
ncbi:MAG: endonuclease-3 [Candidatus Deianiraeaceae bacterium]